VGGGWFSSAFPSFRASFSAGAFASALAPGGAGIHNGVRRYRWRTVLSAQRPSEVRGSAQRPQLEIIGKQLQAEGKHNKLWSRATDTQ